MTRRLKARHQGVFPCLGVLTLLVLVSCGPVREKGEGDSPAVLNDSVRYLAGLPLDEKSRYREASLTPGFRRHAAAMDRFWKQVTAGTIEPMRPWLEGKVPAGGADTAFYPMSGADFVNFFLIYPDERRYVMVAMEIPGELPDLLSLPEKKRDTGLLSIERVVQLYGRKNYFQSRVMKYNMYNQSIPGAVPVILVFMARMGCRVTHLEPVGIDSSGSLVALDRAGSPAAYPGVRIHFYVPGRKGVRELVYLSMKVDDRSLRKGTPTAKYLNGLGSLKTILKSAIYLLHMNGYGDVKRFLLERSRVIVQDDSGIPYGDFSGRWEMELYGNYRYFQVQGTVYSFQKKLRDDYVKKGKGVLPFNYGYGSLRNRESCNMQIAKKKKL